MNTLYGCPFPPVNQEIIGRSPIAPTLRLSDVIYVAARFERQAEARAFVEELRRAGYTTRCRWIYAPGLARGNPELERVWALNDLNDIDNSDVYILLSDDVLGRGGKDFEGGYAFARGKRLIVIGPRAHVFHALPGVRHIQDMMTFRFMYLNGEKIDEVL